jgi:PEGA domain
VENVADFRALWTRNPLARGLLLLDLVRSLDMKTIKLGVLILALLTVVPLFQTKAEASGGFSFGVGYGYYPRYYGYPYYRPFYRPYGFGPYWGGYGGYPYWGGYGGYYGGYGGYYGGYVAPYGYSGYYPFFGDVRTEVKPKEANVYVDGAFVGTVDSFDGWWQRLQLAPGKHRIVFRAPGYVPYAVTIQALPGQDVKIKQQMQPGQDVISESDMMLSEAEREEGNGDRNYDTNRPSSRPRNPSNPYGWDSNPNSRNQENSGNSLSMQPQNNDRRPLVLRVTPKDATIYIDENYYGTADVNSSGTVQVLLPPGIHKIEIVRPGYESFTQEVKMELNAENKLDVNLQKK